MKDSIGDRVRFLRLKKGLTMEMLAETLKIPIVNENGNVSDYKHVTKATIGNLENNRNKPNIDLIIAISDYFNVSTDWILKGQEHKGEKLGVLSQEELKFNFAITPEDKLKEIELEIKKIRSDLGLNND